MTFKKLAKYIIISAIFKSILKILEIILIFFCISVIYLYLLVWILLIYSFFICKNKAEFIITIVLLAGFWFIVSYTFNTYEVLGSTFLGGGFS